MRFRHPLYVVFALLLTVYVAVANHNGWSLINIVVPQLGPHGYASTMHK